jgi:hypothetical protein
VQRIVDEIRGLGIADRDILILSSEPFEEYEFSHRDKATWLRWIAGAGGALGLVGGYALTSTTQQSWPLLTSGMPIVAMWPNAIILFELTMLGAILATVVTLLVCAGLPGRRSALYSAEISNGYILVGVENPPQSLVSRLQPTLEGGGAERVTTVV